MTRGYSDDEGAERYVVFCHARDEVLEPFSSALVKEIESHALSLFIGDKPRKKWRDIRNEVYDAPRRKV